jgi:hypothetical protein
LRTLRGKDSEAIFRIDPPPKLVNYRSPERHDAGASLYDHGGGSKIEAAGNSRSQSSASSTVMIVRLPTFLARNRPCRIS